MRDRLSLKLGFAACCVRIVSQYNIPPLLNLQKRLESLTEAELEALLEEVEEEKTR